MNRFIDNLFRLDLRSLALFRILLACLLIHDWFTRWPDLEAFYTLKGAMPPDLASWHPVESFYFSPLDSFTTLTAVQIVFCLGLLCYALFLVGWQSRIMTVLCLLFYVSIVNRNVMIRAHSDVVIVTTMLWAMFLPLGQRFSVDAWLRRGKPGTNEARPLLSEPTLAAFAMILQIGLIYFWTAFAKSGETWRDGTALYYALHFEPLTRPAGLWLGEQFHWCLQWLTWGTLWLEFAALPLLFVPIAFVRRAIILALTTLHIGIAVTMDIGSFPFIMMSLNVLLLRPEDWTLLWRSQPSGTLSAPCTANRLAKVLLVTKELVVAVVLAAVLMNGANFMRDTMGLRPVHEPVWVRAIIQSTQAIQDWRMFAPDPPRKTAWWLVVAKTYREEELDLRTGEFVDWKRLSKAVPDHDRFWTYYLHRLDFDNNRDCGRAYGQYLWSQLGGKSKQGVPLMRVEIYRVESTVPPPVGPPPPEATPRMVGSYLAPPRHY